MNMKLKDKVALVTGLVVFLASVEARYITGQVYAVDGGFTMQ